MENIEAKFVADKTLLNQFDGKKKNKQTSTVLKMCVP